MCHYKNKMKDKIGCFNKYFDKQVLKYKISYIEEINVQN